MSSAVKLTLMGAYDVPLDYELLCEKVQDTV
jgi:hypothetical protein